MRDRYKPVAMVAGLLVLMGIAMHVIMQVGFKKNTNDQENVVIVVLIGVAVVMIICSYVWSVRHPIAHVVPELLLVVAIGCIGTVVIAPLFVAVSPFHDGAGDFFEQIWIYLGVGLGASLLGWLVALAVGQDYRAKQLKRFAATVSSKPHRPVRR